MSQELPPSHSLTSSPDEPLLLNPSLQIQVNPLAVLEQMTFMSQLFSPVVHSLTLKQFNPPLSYPEGQSQVYPPPLLLQWTYLTHLRIH